MKIYSWNIFFRNKNFDAVLLFIEQLDFDVICLQEVPEHLLERVKQLPFHVVSGLDVDRSVGAHVANNHLVTISKHPIRHHHEFSIPIPKIPWRTYQFIKLMRWLHWSVISKRGGLSADIAISGERMVRVINMHVTLAYPHSRAEELGIAMREVSAENPTVICGDFNIIESFHVAVLNWMLGGSVADALLWRRERTAMEKFFRAHGFKNPLHKFITHGFSASQLDHILVPHDAKVVEQKVLKETVGSDHRPVFVDMLI